MNFENKRVLFITTKNLDYLRNVQEIELIKNECKSLEIIGSSEKGYFKRLLKVYTSLIKVKKSSFDLTFVGFAPQLVVPFFKRKLKSSPLYIDFFISMYDTLCLDRQKFKPNSLIGKILKRIDAKTLSAADVIISDTKAHAKFFSSELGADNNKINTLYLKADETIYYPREKSNADSNAFTVLYFGSVLPLQGVDVVLKAADILKDEKNIRFVIIGPVSDKFSKPISDNIEYHDWLSQEALAEKIAQSDLCLAGHFNEKIDKAKRTIPGKAYIYKAMEKPMILGENEANHELFAESDNGIYFVEMGNANALAAKIRDIKSEAEKCSKA